MVVEKFKTAKRINSGWRPCFTWKWLEPGLVSNHTLLVWYGKNMKYIVKFSFYQRVGKLEDVKIMKQNSRFSLQVFLESTKGPYQTMITKALTWETIHNTMFYQALNLS